VAWQLTNKNYFDFDRFSDLMKGWGFASDKNQLQELYDWLDHDKDGNVTWNDFRLTAGSEIAPME